MRASLYYPFIRDWLEVFPRNQLLVLRMEDYAADPTRVFGDIANFLDVGEHVSLVKLGILLVFG